MVETEVDGQRVGYRWLGTWGKDLLEKEYPAWKAKWLNSQ